MYIATLLAYFVLPLKDKFGKYLTVQPQKKF